MLNILCVGEASYDKVFNVDDFIKENVEYELPYINKVGGSACSIAYLLSEFNLGSYFVGMIGSDEAGLSLKRRLEEKNVDTSYMMSNLIKTPSNIIIENKKNNSKTSILCDTNKNFMDNININISPDIILVDGKEYDLSESLINKNKDTLSIMVASKCNEQTFKMAKRTDFVICSETFANMTVNTKISKDNLEGSYLKLKRYFNNIIVSLDDGSYLYEDGGQIKIMPGISSNSDINIFTASFIYAILNKYKYEEATLFANTAVSLKDNLDIKKIERKYHEYR